MTRVVVLGATGMLGSMLVDYLARAPSIELVGTVRGESQMHSVRSWYPSAQFHCLDVESCTEADVLRIVEGAAWVVNAVGLIKQRIVERDDGLVERAIRINSLFSFSLATMADKAGFRIVQVATDCVYSGSSGKYGESSLHDCNDVYGRTKSLGEVHSRSMHNLRCSIVGPEPNSGVSLLNWFLSQPRNGRVNGFVNHLWNGVTTLHFAKLVKGIVEQSLVPPNRHHIVPRDEVTKDQLLRLFANAYNRGDISINSVETDVAVDRTLITEDAEFNRRLWAAAGYDEVPTICKMIAELAEYQGRIQCPRFAD